MKKTFYFVTFVIGLGILLGFTTNDTPNPITKKFNKVTSQKNHNPKGQTDNRNSLVITGIPYYTDNFDGANDTNSLKARGYLVYKNGTSTGTVAVPSWFQGIPGTFSSFNGPDSGYVAANFQIAGTSGDIDSWLVTPRMNTLTGDTICFYARSFDDNPFPDSIRVMYSVGGDSTPDASSWIELGRFLANDDSAAFASTRGFELKQFMVPSSGGGARFAIRYAVVNGGLFGINSNYIGIDALNVKRDIPLPVELASFTAIINNNQVTLTWITAVETNNSGFEIERLASRSGSIVNGQWSNIGFIGGNGTTNSPMSYSFLDRGLSNGKYNYRLKQIDYNGDYEYFNLSSEVEIGVPINFYLSQNYPNPFNSGTVINYQLPSFSNVKLTVYDMSGKEVKSHVIGNQEAGYYTIKFNASELSSGIYFYTLIADNFVETKSMILVK